MLALAAVLAADAVSRAGVARQADVVSETVDPLISVVRLGFAIGEETAPVRVSVEAGYLGMTPEQAARLIGTDLAEETRLARIEVDTTAASLRGEPWLEEPLRLIAQVRVRMDAGKVTTADIHAMHRAQSIVQSQAQQLARLLRQRASAMAGGVRVVEHVHVLEKANDLLLAYSDLTVTFFTSLSAPTSDLAARADAVRALTRYEVVGEEPAAVDVEPVASAWSAIERSSEVRAFLGAVHQWVDGPGTDAARDVPAAANVLTDAGEVRDLHLELVEAVNRLVRADIEELRRDTVASFTRALLAAVAVAILALLMTGLLVRGVTRPLRDLAERARRLSDGDLWLDPPTGRAPREVLAVSGAFNDVVTHLRLVEEQAEALADGDVTHESLSRRAPGRLGYSLHQSVDRLSSSITERERLESRLRHESTHDNLTGLLNRSAAILAIEQGVARAHRGGTGLAVLVADLDGLARVNEALGHDGGDDVLRRSAARLTTVVRGGDIVARLGADEFVVVAEVEGIDVAVGLGQRMVTSLAGAPSRTEPGFGEPAGTLTASVGVAMTFDGSDTPTELLHDADAAVRRAKKHGAGRVEVFDEDLRRRLSEQSRIEQALRRAMEQDQLRLHYQPILDMEGRIVGLEALCRWSDPELGNVPPSVFVTVAEASGLIHELDRWVLGTATREVASWQAQGELQGVYLSVNLSGRHLLDPSVVGDVWTSLERSGFDPRLLVLEITETVLLQDLFLAAAHLTALRTGGIRVAVDDFGTGYTSIAHLRHLPVDIVKIDRSFVTEIEGDRGQSLVRLMVGIGATLGLSVVAEGVESTEEYERLREVGCQHVQGFLFARPMPGEEVRTWAVTVPDRSGSAAASRS